MKNLILILCLFLFFSCSPEKRSIETENTNFKWEFVNSDGLFLDFYRARIYGGWLVCRGYHGEPITFIPLQNPDGWEIKPITNQNKAK